MSTGNMSIENIGAEIVNTKAANTKAANTKAANAETANTAKSALEYGKEACDTLMKTFTPQDLPPKGRFHYHQGVFLSGMQKIYEICSDEKYLEYSKAWVDSIIDENGRIVTFDKGQLDDLQPGVLLYMLDEHYHEPRYKKALDVITDIIWKFPKNKEGGLWHKEKNREQMWLDSLYMGGPVLAQYGALYGKKEFWDLCVFQAVLMEEKTRDEKTGLFYHAWDSVKEQVWADSVTGRAPEIWGRAMGWVPVALLEELDFMPEDYEGAQKLKDIVKRLLIAVVPYQDKNTGLWYQVIDKGGQDGNWLESSCTCLFTSAICKAVAKGLLDASYLEYAKNGYDGIVKRLKFDENGIIIDNICVGTGVGDYEHYCKRPTSANDLHGVGAFLLMCEQTARMGW